jgi:hypothetical protein
VLAPAAGSVLFGLLYGWAALRYPGGAPNDPTTPGFSWTRNYWCNLLNETALNGQPNPARPVALGAMLVLGLTLILFWYEFPRRAGLPPTGRRLVQTSGALAMVLGLFIFTPLHDALINLASLFGLVAVVGTLAGLRRLRWGGWFGLGLFNLVLVGLNNLLYYGEGLLPYLPVVQKFTFLAFLLWIGGISLTLFRRTTAR